MFPRFTSQNMQTKIDTVERALFSPRRAPITDEELSFLASGQHAPVVFEGITIPTWSWGTGPRVLLAHGWESRGAQMGVFVPALVGLGMSATLFDAPAHGETPGVRSSVVHMGRALAAVSAALGDVKALIGHSVGSAAALWAFSQGVKPLCSAHLAGPANLANVLRNASRMGGLDAAEFQELLTRTSTFIGCPVEQVGLPILSGALQHPGFIMHDLEDRVVPSSESEELHAHWPLSELSYTRGLGHRRLLTDPGSVNRTTEFVARVLVPSRGNDLRS